MGESPLGAPPWDESVRRVDEFTEQQHLELSVGSQLRPTRSTASEMQIGQIRAHADNQNGRAV